MFGGSLEDQGIHAMTQEQAFLYAIREAPEDDAPRLIYADWLDGADRLSLSAAS